jgi:hypothetical protein
MYSYYVKSNGDVEEITTDNKNKLIGKTVNMRFSSLCERTKDGCMCEKCCGTLFRRAGIANAGLTSMVLMSAVKNKAMSSFHNSTLSLVEIDPNEAFSLN